MAGASPWSQIEPHLWRMPARVLAEAAAKDRFPATVAALACGYRAAEALRELASTANPWALASFLGVAVEHAAQPPAAGFTPRLRSEYLPDQGKVMLYAEPLVELAALIYLHSPRFGHLDLPALHLAHELFHHLECARRDLVPSALASRPLSELAAHAFAQALLDLDFFPVELDLLHAPAAPEQPAPALAPAGEDAR